MTKLTIDSKEVEVPAGATVLDAARALGIEIPTLCYLPGRPAQTSCMVCVVKIEGKPRLAPACATPAEDGMVVFSEDDEVREARRSALELLLGEHLGDCMAPCHSICPCRMDIPRMIRRIAAGRLADAIATVKAQIALPAVLGRICNVPCEKGCRRGQYDLPVSICLLKRFVADVDLARAEPYLPPKPAASGKKIAIVGAGATGLSAAWFLQAAGHACTLFDSAETAGGMLRAEDLHEKLPPDVLDAEIATIARAGAAFRFGVRVGQDVSLADLRRDYDAVLIATGDPSEGGLEAPGLDVQAGLIAADKKTYATPADGVFAAGPCMRAGKLIVRAVADGRFVADSVDQYLAGRPVVGSVKPFTVHIGKMQDGEAERFLAEATDTIRLAPAAPGGGLDQDEARHEALRCFHCDCRAACDCRLRDFCDRYAADGNAYQGARAAFTQDRSHAEVIYEAGKCIACGICIRLAAEAGEKLGLAFLGRGFDVRVGAPFGGQLVDALGRSARTCVEHCPTGALALREEA